MTLSAYLLFLPACFAINMAFGPNNLLSVTNGAKHGVSPAVVAASGRLVAFAIMIAIAGLGMGAVLVASEMAFDVIKYIGAAYLVWIGIRLLRAPAPAMTQAAASGTPPSLRALARQEFTVAAGNPKAILVFTAFLPQFVDIAKPMLPQFTVLGASFLVLECVAIALYSWAGMHLGKWLTRSKVRRWFNRCCGTFLGAIGISFLLVRRA